MSTRAHIALYDQYDKEVPGALLYHHSDGYPEFMEPYLERMLEAVSKFLERAGYSYWWDSERVAAVMVLLSSTCYEEPSFPDEKRIASDPEQRYKGGVVEFDFNGGVPYCQPCTRMHGDVEFLWKVKLLPEGKFEIEYEEVAGRCEEVELEWARKTETIAEEEKIKWDAMRVKWEKELQERNV